MLTRPHPLKKGDPVAVTAPSSPAASEAVRRAEASLRLLGLKPVIMESCTLCRGYLSGPDQIRARDINRAFSDPSIKGIFCIRGGYGAARLLPLLDFDVIRKNPKIFVGFSDVTALHLAFNQLCGFVTFHGPMPGAGYDSLTPFSLESLKKHLFSDSTRELAVNPPGQDLQSLYPGKASGMIVGGNLSVLLGMLGSPYEVDTRGRILFIEDVGERPYRLDRALTALSLAGKFRDCSGVLLGTFTQCEEPPANGVFDRARTAESSLSLSDIFNEIILPWRKPVISNFRAGHIDPQITVPLGAQAVLDASGLRILFQG